ncbi:MAG: RAMP superfamily CRISPR-associated protein [Candidatus Methanofastidiosia archaeon]
MATAREPSGCPIIPASALKGAIRIEFERIARKKGIEVCSGGDPSAVCGKEKEKPCIACSVFGSSGLLTKVRFKDAVLSNNIYRKLFTIGKHGKEKEKSTGFGYILRHGTAISRTRKVVEEGALFTLETLPKFPEHLVLESKILLLQPLEKQELEMLKLALANLRAIGADKCRGLGQVQVSWKEVEETEKKKASQQEKEENKKVVYKMILVPKEYVRVSDVKAKTNFLETLKFLPGSTVRGGVARSFAKEKGWNSEDFRKAFLKDPVIFSNFYPTVVGDVPPKPIPLSTRTCKKFPGFKFKKKDEERESHGAKDLLIPATVVAKLQSAGVPAFLEDKCEIENCGSRLKPYQGYYLYAGSEGLAGPTGRLRMTTKTAINRSRLTSEEGQLYSYELIDTRLEYPVDGIGEEKRLHFIGNVINITDALLEYLQTNPYLLVGGARNRGYGEVEVKIEKMSEEKEEDLKKRLLEFTKAIRSRLKEAGLKNINDQDIDKTLFFSLTLTSDLILPPYANKEWFINLIAKEFKLKQDNLKLEKAFTAISYRGGFNDALGILKDYVPILEKGSAFVLSYPEDGETDIVNALPKLLKEGIGWHKKEGFGRFSFCDEFHIKRIKQI